MPAFTGVYVAAITPRREGPEIDLGAAYEVIDFLSASGVSGIALLGSTGEFPHFTLEDRARLVRLGVKRSRVPVIAGVTHSTLDGTLRLAREAVDSGVAGLLIMPPYYFRYGQEAVLSFYRCVADELGGAAPLLLYNIPQFTSGVEAETAAELLTSGLYQGIKDSCGQWSNLVRLLELRRRCAFSLIAGHDVLFTPARLGGADGVISGVAAAVPELLVALDRVVSRGDAAAAWRLDVRIQEFIARLEWFPAPIAIREAAALRGLKPGPHAVPLGPETGRRLADFRQWFRDWLPIVLQESKNA